MDSTQQLPFPSVPFSISHKETSFNFHRPAEPDAVLDAVPEKSYEIDRFLPYWAENWPSATPFFHYILDMPFPGESTALELGCGLGVLSTALSLKNLFTVSVDISPESCLFAQHNIHLNNTHSNLIVSDWRSLSFKNVLFDLIVASDVLYEERWISVILTCIETFLNKEGKALIADPCRRYWHQFKETAKKHDFDVVLLHKEKVGLSETTVEIIELSKG